MSKVIESLELINNIFKNNLVSMWLVGGCIRDIVMNKIPKDYDLATDTHPHRILDICQNNHIAAYESGIKYGTVTLIVNDIPFEVTTFRKDSITNDGRRPDYVEFSNNILDDLARRDFRMNAMALYLNDYLNSNFMVENIIDKIIDPHNGLEDIKNNEINCVGNPMDRFNEDALRMLRAIRFATKYNFSIGKDTLDAIYKSHNNLVNVSIERITSEFNQILMNFNLKVNDLHKDEYLNKWRLTNFIIKKIIPEMYTLSDITHNSNYHLYDVYTHSLLVCAALNTDNICVKLAGLFHDIGKMNTISVDSEKLTKHYYHHPLESIKLVETIMKRMRYSNDEIEITLKLIEFHDVELQNNKKSIKRILNKIGENLFEDLINLKIADRENHLNKPIKEDDKNEIIEIYKNILRDNEVFSIKDLTISGTDLINLGYTPSPLFSKILNDCVNECIENPKNNTKDYLLQYICEKY